MAVIYERGKNEEKRREEMLSFALSKRPPAILS